MSTSPDPYFKHAVINMIRAYRDGVEETSDKYFTAVDMDELKLTIKIQIENSIKSRLSVHPDYILMENISGMFEEARVAYLQRRGYFFFYK